MNSVLSSVARNLLRSAGRRAFGSQRRLNLCERDIAFVEREVLRAQRAAAVQTPHDDMTGFFITYTSVMTGIALAVAYHRYNPVKTCLDRSLEMNASK